MHFLVNDLLDYFQIKKGKFQKNLKYIDVKQSLENLIEMFNVGASEKQINLIYECDEDIPSRLLLDE